MSLNIHQIITDTKRLAGRLKERDAVADLLLNDTHAINKKIDAMKHYEEEVEQQNELSHQKPHSQLIANIQRENRHLRELQQENRELRAALEEHQNALEHIMTKYRQHTTQQIYKSRIDLSLLHNLKYNEIIDEQAEKINEMALIMQKAAATGDAELHENEEILSRLRYENQGLREMLQISCKNGSLGKLSAPVTEDKHIQTENVTNST